MFPFWFYCIKLLSFRYILHHSWPNMRHDHQLITYQRITCMWLPTTVLWWGPCVLLFMTTDYMDNEKQHYKYNVLGKNTLVFLLYYKSKETFWIANITVCKLVITMVHVPKVHNMWPYYQHTKTISLLSWSAFPVPLVNATVEQQFSTVPPWCTLVGCYNTASPGS